MQAMLFSLSNLLDQLLRAVYLSAALVFVEEKESSDAVHDICTLVHDNDSSSPQSTLGLNQRIEIHQNILTYTVHVRQRERSPRLQSVMGSNSTQGSFFF